MTDPEPSLEPLRIIELRASNMMRLKAVAIRPNPDDDVIVISGPNGAGKSSLLNAIWLALGGGPAAKNTPVPVRQGEEHGSVYLDLGRFRVTRKFSQNGKPTLTVTSADGAKYPSAQTFLDGFMGEFTFDPLAFMRQTAKEQLGTLLKLVDLPFDLDIHDAERQRIFEGRTIIGRERDRLQAQLAAAAETAPPSDIPKEELSIADLLAEATEARAVLADNNRLRNERVQAHAKANATAVRVEQLENALAEARNALANEVADVRHMEKRVSALVDPDVAGIEARVADAEQVNRQVRAGAEYRRLVKAAQDAVERYEGETFLIAENDGRRTQAIAEAEMPMAGLSFDDRQVLFNGVPIQQASGAEQLRISMAIGMAVNPTVRVMCIPDGSLLDDNSMRLVEQMAAEHKYQVFIERVSMDGEGAGFVIEDGEVVG